MRLQAKARFHGELGRPVGPAGGGWPWGRARPVVCAPGPGLALGFPWFSRTE